MSSEHWTEKVKAEGRRAAVELTGVLLSDEEFDRLTDSQAMTMCTAIKLYLTDADKRALDYGCGWGRFSDHLSSLVPGGADAFDSCQEMLDLADLKNAFIINDQKYLHPESYDLILVAWVLQGVDNFEEVVEHIAGLLTPGGMLVVVDVMRVRYDGGGRFQHFQHFTHYVDAFAAYGIKLEIADVVQQYGTPCPMLLGRKT